MIKYLFQIFYMFWTVHYKRPRMV
ncbi:hypothetical protein PT2222_180001 [Paraburkholderia tropica]